MANLTQIPGAPSIEACQVVATTANTEAQVLKLFSDIKSTITKIIQLLRSVLYGTINIYDIVSTELFTAVEAAATTVASAVAQSISGAVNSILESILSQILQILLAFPDAIFSLVAIPLEKAVESAINEQQCLFKAKNGLDTARKLLTKWVSLADDPYFYNQMKAALPYIDKSLNLINQMLSQLNIVSQPIDVQNSVFDQTKYQNLELNLREAINITQPTPALSQTNQVVKTVTKNFELQRKEKIAAIDQKYEELKRKLDLQYSNQISKANPNSNTLKDVLMCESINLNWANQVKILNGQKQLELAQVETTIDYSTLISSDELQNAGKSIYDSFISDMNNAGNYLDIFYVNIKNAYAQNLLCQTYCTTVYNVRVLILQLIKTMIALLRQTGNASAEIAIGALDSAESLVSTTKNIFEQNISNYEGKFKGISSTSSFEMSIALSAGNTLLQTASSTLTGLITTSLIKLINSDDVLAANNAQFDDFIKKLSEIPDWNSQSESWILNVISDATLNPYIQLVADATELISLLPILTLSRRPDDETKLFSIVNNVTRQFNKVKSHNGLVLSVLTSYIPYQSSSCGILKRLLNRLGLLDSFAQTLDLASLVNSVITFSSSLIAPGEQEPTLKNCKAFYPDLFIDPEVVASLEVQKANTLPPSAQNDVIAPSLEKTEQTRIEAKSFKENLDFTPSRDDIKTERQPTEPSLGNEDVSQQRMSASSI